MRIGLIGGTSVNRSRLFASWDACLETTDYGEVAYRKKGCLVALNRHGPEGGTPPHAINFRANIRFFEKAGVAEIISLNSVGSLDLDLPPGTLVSCSDYVSFRPATFRDREVRPVVPGISNTLLPAIAKACSHSIEGDKVYVQTSGPRFETRAEIRIIRGWGDVVGMTLGSEADLCAETGIGVNSVAMVDNFANGLAAESLSVELFERRVRENQNKVDQLLGVIAELYG